MSLSQGLQNATVTASCHNELSDPASYDRCASHVINVAYHPRHVGARALFAQVEDGASADSAQCGSSSNDTLDLSPGERGRLLGDADEWFGDDQDDIVLARLGHR
jgi:hypothetical protein